MNYDFSPTDQFYTIEQKAMQPGSSTPVASRSFWTKVDLDIDGRPYRTLDGKAARTGTSITMKPAM